MRERLATPLAEIFGNAVRLGGIAALVVGALATIDQLTRPRIMHNQQQALVASLVELTGDARLGALSLKSPLPDYLHLCEASTTRYQLIRATATGYAGAIEYTIALSADEHILGVRVTRHGETPGLGDAMETGKSDWIHQLAGQPRAATISARWGVRQDGGDFDSMTGATITSRAILRGVQETLTGLLPPSELTCTPLN
jgi:electron transport complex protein RnfG